jgi:hypothetical protein
MSSSAISATQRWRRDLEACSTGLRRPSPVVAGTDQLNRVVDSHVGPPVRYDAGLAACFVPAWSHFRPNWSMIRNSGCRFPSENASICASPIKDLQGDSDSSRDGAARPILLPHALHPIALRAGIPVHTIPRSLSACCPCHSRRQASPFGRALTPAAALCVIACWAGFRRWCRL